MSNVIPIVSSSPPPLDEMPSFEEDHGHDEDFGGFATAPSPKELFKPITSEEGNSFSSFPDQTMSSAKDGHPSEQSNGVDTNSDWADFAGFHTAPPPDLPNGEEEDFADFADCHSNSSFQDSNVSVDKAMPASVISSNGNRGNSETSAGSASSGSKSSEPVQSNSQSLSFVSADSRDIDPSLGDLDDLSTQTQSNCKSVKRDSQDNTSQGSVTDSGLSSDVSPGLKLEDFTEFPTDSKESKIEISEHTDSDNKPGTESKPEVGNLPSQLNDIRPPDGNTGQVTGLEPQPLQLRPVASFSKVDPESYPEDDSGTFGQFEDFVRPGTFETGSDSDTKVSDNFPADSDSQKEEDSEFEEFKKSGDSDSSMPNDSESSALEGCDKSEVTDTTRVDVPSVEVDNEAEEEFEDFQDLQTATKIEVSGATDIASPESGYSDKDIPNSETVSGDALPYQNESKSEVNSAQNKDWLDNGQTAETTSDIAQSKMEDDGEEEFTDFADFNSSCKEESGKSGKDCHNKDACDGASTKTPSLQASDQEGEFSDTTTTKSINTGTLAESAQQGGVEVTAEVSVGTAPTTDFSKFEPPPMEENDDDFADFADFKSSGTGYVAPAPDGGWAAFSGDDVKPADDSSDDWAAFSEPHAKKPEPKDDSSNVSTKNGAADQEDDFGDFGDHTTTPSLPTAQSYPASTIKHTAQLGHPNLNIMLDKCFPLAELSDRTESGVEGLTKCIDLQVLRKQDLENHNTPQNYQKHAKSVTVDLCVWNNLKDIENTAALKYSWNQSNNSKCLLRAVGIDTRNILIGHKKLPMPIFASSLGLLEPVRGAESQKDKISLHPSQILQPVTDTTNASSIPTVSSIGTPQQDIPPAEFDWSSAGLTNPLDASSSLTLDLDFFVKQDSSMSYRHSRSAALEKEQELLQAIEPALSGPPKVLQPLESFLTNLKYQSAPPSEHNKKHNLECLTPEASKLLKTLPDMSFMKAHMLMFPLRGATD